MTIITFFSFFLFYICNMQAAEYVYPVAYNAINDTIIYLHQMENETNAVQVNIPLKKIENILPSYYNPAYIQYLKDNTGFSFIDQGCLRIKEFVKRSALRLDFSLPLQQIYSATWIDDMCCMIGAKYKDSFGIFTTNKDGDISILEWSNQYDALYPQYIGSTLYYISRKKIDGKNHYSICQKASNNTSYLDFENQEIAFLQMKDNKEGIVLLSKDISEDNYLTITVCQIIFGDNNSYYEILFSYKLPKSLLDPKSEECLFEGMLPLNPLYIDDTIYFVDSIELEGKLYLDTFMYDCKKKEISPFFTISNQINEHHFGFVDIGNNVIFGGSYTL